MASKLQQDFEQLKLSEVRTSKFKRELGRGSYGIVYEVEMGGTLFAAKEMHSILRSSENESESQRINERGFLDECLQCSRISHPNVVQFIGLYRPTQADIPWLVMELMDKSLTKLIEDYAGKKKDIPLHFKLSILLDTCKGLQFLHSKSIIHRDLSSNNILLTKHCVAKIADLGVTKVLKEGTQSFTRGVCTPAFLPPEGRVSKPIYGLPYDIFSLGCVCIHLVSMQFPTPTNDMVMDEAARRLTRVDLTEFERRIEHLTKFPQTPDLQPLVEWCLKDAAKERPTTTDVIQYLKNVDYDRQPHENDGIIDLYDCMSAYKAQLEGKERELQKSIQQLEEKEKEIEDKDVLLAIAESKRDFVSQQLKNSKRQETVMEKEPEQAGKEADLQVFYIGIYRYQEMAQMGQWGEQNNRRRIKDITNLISYSIATWLRVARCF